ncbi:MAG: LysM peptidoglycan-binding domain-containing protein [Actinobacteria bacterium]|nr:LysM peptidoglycan-binding domain-containing protein [Actinomycetota bacterium]
MDRIFDTASWLGGVTTVSIWILSACAVYVLAWIVASIRVRIMRGRRPRRSRISTLPRLLPLVGLALAAGPRQEEKSRSSAPPSRIGSVISPPWTHMAGEPVDEEDFVPRREAHPAIHPEHAGRSREAVRLFPRAGRRSGRSRQDSTRYVICVGDTLWDIAQRELRSSDPVEIDDYWHRIWSSNRDALTSNPNLIHPGVVLELPPLTT